MLTPRDIHEAEFKRVWKGYSPEEVDDFLRRVVLEYEAVYKENQSLREQIQSLEREIEKYASSETQVSLTLEMAKQAAADAKESAGREAEAILRRARVEAEEILSRARRAASSQARTLVAFQEDVDRFRSRAASVLREFLREIDEWENPVPTVIKEVAAGLDEEGPDLRVVRSEEDGATQPDHNEDSDRNVHVQP